MGQRHGSAVPSLTDTPLILFGAFDRHNFGDLLLAHIAARRARDRFPGRPLTFAGVAERDLRPCGGHRVRAISALAREWGDRPAEVCHVGGELLTCSLYEAAIMVLPPDEATAAIVRFDAHPAARQAWAETQLGLRQHAAYLVPKALFRRPGRFTYQAVGGVELPTLPLEMQAEARARLMEADSVSVRDRVTQGRLAAWGMRTELEPDPGERVAELFGPPLARHAASGAPAAIREHFPQGYVAVQFSGDFGDDASLEILAARFGQFIRETGLGLCLFRAGAAPWHDDAGVYRRFMGLLQTDRVRLFDSLHLWDICALLAQARAYCGSSLHGRIVARAFGVPGISLVRQPAPPISKVGAYVETWWNQGGGGLAGLEDVHRALRRILDQ